MHAQPASFETSSLQLAYPASHASCAPTQKQPHASIVHRFIVLIGVAVRAATSSGEGASVPPLLGLALRGLNYVITTFTDGCREPKHLLFPHWLWILSWGLRSACACIRFTFRVLRGLFSDSRFPAWLENLDGLSSFSCLYDFGPTAFFMIDDYFY